MRPALSCRICRQGRPLQPVPAGRAWQVRSVQVTCWNTVTDYLTREYYSLCSNFRPSHYGLSRESAMAYADIHSFLMAYAKSLSFVLGFISSLCIRHSRAGPMPLWKPHSAGVFFDLTIQYDRCPVIHAFRSVFVDKMISDCQPGSLRPAVTCWDLRMYGLGFLPKLLTAVYMRLLRQGGFHVSNRLVKTP